MKPRSLGEHGTAVAAEDVPEQTIPTLNVEKNITRVKDGVHPGGRGRACKKSMESKRACMFEKPQ